MVHAGLLLLKARDEDALPVFVQGFRRTDIDPFGEWFGEKLRLYGPAAVPALTELLHDDEADVWGRMEAARELSPIAGPPQTQDEILSALRRGLPTQVDESPPDVSDEIADILWTNVACELARHRDAERRPQIEALFDHDLLDVARKVRGNLLAPSLTHVLRQRSGRRTRSRQSTWDVGALPPPAQSNSVRPHIENAPTGPSRSGR